MQRFVKRWLGGEEPTPVEPFLPQGQRIYCVGDIHGRLDLMLLLHQLMATDAADYDGDKTLVYLGDYIDRGEQSKEVIESLVRSPLEGFNIVHLLGNHEQTLLDFLQHPRAVASWLTFGGLATLHSYGVTPGSGSSPKDINELRDDLEFNLPQNHRHFYENLEYMHIAGNYCFVHAGIRPGIPMQEQRNEDFLWIRDDFTHSTKTHEHIVVHGHSITPKAEFLPNRIGIDTGAFHSGVLTCLVLEGSEQRLLQTGFNG